VAQVRAFATADRHACAVLQRTIKKTLLHKIFT